MSKQQATELDADIGAIVATAMFRRRITQTELSERVGISQSALSRLLRGRAQWTFTRSVQVASVLGCDVLDLLPERLDPIVRGSK